MSIKLPEAPGHAAGEGVAVAGAGKCARAARGRAAAAADALLPRGAGAGSGSTDWISGDASPRFDVDYCSDVALRVRAPKVVLFQGSRDDARHQRCCLELTSKLR